MTDTRAERPGDHAADHAALHTAGAVFVDRAWSLTPLLLLALAPWLADPRADLLWIPLAAALLTAGLLALGIAADALTRHAGSPVAACGAGLLVLACALVLLVVRGPDLGGAGSTLRIVAFVLAVAGAVLVLRDDLQPSGPPVFAAVVAVVAMIAASFVQDASDEAQVAGVQHDRLLGMGIAAAYLPEIDGHAPSSALLDEDTVILFYPHGRSETGSVTLSHVPEVCADGRPPLGADCQDDTDSREAVAFDDGTLVVYTADPGAAVPEDVSRELGSLRARPLDDLVDLLGDQDQVEEP